MAQGDEGKEDRERERVAFERKLDGLEARIGLKFERREVLREAMTHSSYAQEDARKTNYERLEFLGDRVLELIICHRLIEMRARDGEGDLTKRLSWLVDEDSLAESGRRIGLDKVVRTGPSLPRGEVPESVIADAMEALVGALFLDRGMGAAERIVLEHVWDDRALGPEPLCAFPRNLLQHKCDQLGLRPPKFEFEFSGPDHQRRYRCHAWVESKDGTIIAESKAEGGGKKAAERDASESLLHILMGANSG
jgi:ribonuclease-3